MGHEHEKVVAGLICGNDLSRLREAVCIQTEKIYDSCREKDCIENAKVLFRCPHKIQPIINNAINVKACRAEVVDVYADVEPVPFKRGFYTVDVKYFIKVSLNFFVPRATGGVMIIPRNGLVVYDKKIILFGSEGNVKIFKSHYEEHGCDKPEKTKLQQDNLPISKVEVAEPIALNAKIESLLDKLFEGRTVDEAPRSMFEILGEDPDDNLDLEMADERCGLFPFKRVVVSLGLFSIIKLARLVQLLIPAFDFCVPNKTCIAATDEDPCNLFDTISFPVDEFFPPQIFDFPGATELEAEMQNDMKHHHHRDND